MSNNVILVNEIQPESKIDRSWRRKSSQDDSKNMIKKFKALMIDCDGTLVQHEELALPSQRVSEAVHKASKKLHVGLATSRGLKEARHIAQHLDLTGPSILNGGALIYDFQTEKVLWEKPIPKTVAQKIADIFIQYHSPDFLRNPAKYVEYVYSNTVYNMYCPAQPEEIARKILKAIEKIPEVSVTYVPSWTKGKFDVLVYQASATKQHGIFEVAKLLNLNPKDFIVIGDGYNDFPLLEAAGLAVAMGNASEELKAIADYVAPTVDEDGVVDVIERFVL